MRSSSAAFAAVLAGSHGLVTRCDVLFNREVVVEGVPVASGKIEYNRTAARLARLSITLADPTRIPAGPDDVLSPYGYELRVWRGVYLPSGAELVPLGTFPIQTSAVDGVSLTSTVTAADRSQMVSDARFEDVYQVPAGTNYATAIQDLIADGVAGLEYLFPSIGFTTPLLTFAAQDDRWQAAQSMATSIGHEIIFDGLGRCVLRPEPTFSSVPAAAIAERENMVGAGVHLDRSTAYNKVVATGRNASNDAEYRGEASDDDPSSPTYYLGPFGKKPRFYSSEFIASDEQAASAAAAILAGNLGVSRSVDFAAVPDPRLECSDVVRITRAALGLDELHIIDSLTIGLGAGDVMTGSSRTRQETLA